MRRATNAYTTSTSWENFFGNQKDPRGDWGAVVSLPHQAAYLLHHYKQKGVPVTMHNANWNQGQREATIRHGPHKSALDHIEFLRTEYADMIRKGFWTMLPAELIKTMPNLRVFSLGVVPQRERRPRPICDYSYFDVNANTVLLAPASAMQFGQALYQALQRIHEAHPRFEPVYLCKIDIADGFYRIGVCPKDAPRLAVSFPSRPGEQQLIAILLVLPMG